MSDRVALVLAVLALGACHTSAPPPQSPAPEGDDEALVCVPWAVGGLGVFTVDSPGEEPPSETDAARRAYAEGVSALSGEQYDVAAGHFLDCARAYRTVPDDYDQLGEVIANARVCYAAAATMWGSGGHYASLGRAALEQAAIDDPRLAEDIRAMLADPAYECVP